MCNNPGLRKLEFSRFANDISWMVSINDLKDLLQARDVMDMAICSPKAYTPVHIQEFRKKMPELFRFSKLEN